VQTGRCILYSSPKAGLNAVPTVKITLGMPFSGITAEMIPAWQQHAVLGPAAFIPYTPSTSSCWWGRCFGPTEQSTSSAWTMETHWPLNCSDSHRPVYFCRPVQFHDIWFILGVIMLRTLDWYFYCDRTHMVVVWHTTRLLSLCLCRSCKTCQKTLLPVVQLVQSVMTVSFICSFLLSPFSLWYWLFVSASI